MRSSRMSVCIGAVSLVIAIPLTFAQTPAALKKSTQDPPRSSAINTHRESREIFEVASVRLSPPHPGLTTINDSGSSHFSAHGVTMRLLVSAAYGISSGGIAGGPKWLDEQAYEVDAKMEGEARLTPVDFQIPLQQLLKERFHLAAHRETVFHPGYDLVIARGGPHLVPAQSQSRSGYIIEDGMRFESVPMEAFAGILAALLGSPVADKTNIKGDFNIDLHYAPRDAEDSDLPSIYTALQESLGLRLVPDEKVPVEILVIDRVERIPTDN